MAKIPPHAERVFKGVIFDIYQWQQPLFDGTVATFEMARRPSTVVVVPLSEGKVFYSRQEQPGKGPFIGLFGGRVEDGEDPFAAAQRELLEESGLESDDWSEFFVFKAPGKIEWEIRYYIARNVRPVHKQKLDAGEKIEICSCPVDEFLNRIAVAPDFQEHELKMKLLSAFNPDAASQIKEILS